MWGLRPGTSILRLIVYSNGPALEPFRGPTRFLRNCMASFNGWPARPCELEIRGVPALKQRINNIITIQQSIFPT